ncbi:putative metalloprotease CJM1_0395 family protein [Billgrantia endophytica]|uniref:SprA-related family protein n=1 Tax=Billgrantia endophytica TaxID=2033802 RepID=A0A2N7UB80_9GAMM|nr:putative metalloprotease CJM1_0395 family protein [Halomonas endophytica]PMR77696.1 SprA-related family protein [Halomonas endophytica]
MHASTVIGPVPFTSNSWQPGGSHLGNADAARRVGEPASGEATGMAAEEAAQGKVAESEAAQKPNGETLSEEELRQLEQLKTIDREVRQHELAHQIAGGQYTGVASYEYERGPDGQHYAVAGQVPIDYGPVPGDPRATIGKMQQVISAALAPADPSPKDHQVAATARQYLLTAQLEMAQQANQRHSTERTEPNTTEGTRARIAADSGTLESPPELTQYDIIARAVQSTGGKSTLSGRA